MSVEILEQQKGHSKTKNALEFVSKIQRANSDAPVAFPRLEKDNRIQYECLIESWRFECSTVRSFINQAKELAEDIWIPCSNLLEEWDIGEFEESLDYVGLISAKLEVINQVHEGSVLYPQQIPLGFDHLMGKF